MRFGQKVLRIARKARLVQCSYKAYCCDVLALISVPWAKFGSGTLKNAILSNCPPSSAWPENNVWYKFHWKPTVFTYWRKFQSGRAIFGSKTLKNAIWPKRPPHRLKSTFSTIFMESLLFSRIGVNFSPVERFLAQKRWKMRFGQHVLRMAWKARLVQFS